MDIDENFLEKNILFQSIKNPYYFGTIIDYVDLSYFSDKDVINVFRVVTTFYQQYGKSPNLTEIKTQLNSDEIKQSFINIIKCFKDLDTLVDIDILITQTETFFKEKKIISTLLDVSEKFNELDKSLIVEKFQDACGLSIITDIGFDYFKDIDDHIKWLQETQNKISTGFDFYDSKLKGGFNTNGRALYVFLGATNSGKSILLANFAANAIRQNLCVPIISLEMDEQLYAQRMSCNFSKIEFDELKNNTEEFKNKINQISSDNPDAQLILKEFPPGKLTVSGLDSYLAKLKKKGYDFNLVFLDYITLMRVENSSGLYESGKRLAEDVRALSYKYGVSFVTVLQANRSGVDGSQPKLDNTSESMGIAHTADFMASIWREEEDVETNTLRTGIIKNRIGENFGVKLLELNTKYLTLKEIDNIFEDDAKEMNDQIKNQIDALSDFTDD